MIKKKLIKTKFDINKRVENNEEYTFLGNHCNFFDYKNNLLNDYCKIENQFWKKYENFLSDYNYLDKLYNKILDNLVISLNKFHKIEKKINFWEVIIGPWIMTFCINLYDKWKISETHAENQNLYTEILSNIDNNFNFLSIEDYKRKISQDYYNHILFSKIFLFLDKNNKCKLDIVKLLEKNEKVEIVVKEDIKKNLRFKQLIENLKKIFKKFFLKFYSKLTRNNKIIIMRNYLGFYNNLKLNLSLKQLPCFYIHNLETENLTENKSRKDFKINFKCDNLFEKFLLEELVHHIPKTFLEKFDFLCDEIIKSNLPLNPKNVFITNFQSNTFLSFYIGLSREKGAKLFSGQHGGCVGQYDKHWGEDFEIKVSDKYFSYGWNSNKFPDKIIPIGFLKPIKKVKFSLFKKKRDILLMIKARQKYIHKLDSANRSSHNFKYIDNIFLLINNLNCNLKKNLKIRLRDQDLGWHEHQRFQLKFPNLRFDFGEKNIFELMRNSKIVLSTNLGTSYLESLAMNIPTIIITNYELEPIRDDSKPLLKLLIDSKILHLNPLSAAQHINSVYDNIESWWLNKTTQQNIKFFCNTYAKINNNINNDLKIILK